MRSCVPQGGRRRRSGFALSLKPECSPFSALARQSGAGPGPMAASPLLSAPPHHRPPLVASRPSGLPGGDPTRHRNARLSALSLAPPRSQLILLHGPPGVPESTVSARSLRDREAGLQGPVRDAGSAGQFCRWDRSFSRPSAHITRGSEGVSECVWSRNQSREGGRRSSERRPE